MTGRAGASGRVLVGVDGSDGARRALDQAVEEAVLRSARLEIVVSWRYWPPEGVTMVTPAFATDAQSVADDAAAAVHRAAPGLEVIKRICPEPAPIALVAESAGAELLVLGSRGLGAFAGLLVGSVSQHCVRHAACPVLVCRENHEAARAAPGVIVVGYDDSDGARRALDWAARESQLRACILRVVTAWSTTTSHAGPGQGDRAAQARGSELSALVGGQWPGLDIEVTVAEGVPAAVLSQAARGAQMLVVGSRGRGGFTGLVLGSVALHCLHDAPCPVVVVPIGRGSADEGSRPTTHHYRDVDKP